ncbi:hypothetical protein H632_c1187p1, partial [Helicosporidium sp. ATCC 50920]
MDGQRLEKANSEDGTERVQKSCSGRHCLYCKEDEVPGGCSVTRDSSAACNMLMLLKLKLSGKPRPHNFLEGVVQISVGSCFVPIMGLKHLPRKLLVGKTWQIRRSNSRLHMARPDGVPEDMWAYCQALPKAELHTHLHGSVPESIIEELASEQSLDVTSAREALREARSRGASLSECFAVFDALHELVNDLSAVRRITAGSLAAFAADNVCYVELRTTPRALRDGSSAEAYLEAVLEAMRGAEGATTPCGLPLLSRLVVSVDRARGSAAAEAAVRLALACRRRHGDWVAGLDLSGDPTKGSWEEVLPALDLARRGRLRVTVHAAEVENPEESAAMLRWRPDRMGHVCCMSQEQFDAMLRLGIPLELCLTSNVVTASVDSVQAHHFATLHPD